MEGKKLNWQKLFDTTRLGKAADQSAAGEFSRNHFARDFDRIIFSTPFRRLQAKTQVVPLPDMDFIHTRLTHSLETSSIGRSVGRLIGMALIERDSEYFRSIGIRPSDFESVIAAACIAHDIGNPPFGHSGEKAISEYFETGRGVQYLSDLTDQQQADLISFEGNALGFRILSHSLPAQTSAPGGLGLTYASLTVFMKYPKASRPVISGSKASEKKYGFFQAEQKIVQTIANAVGLIPKNYGTKGKGWYRHPLAFLVEAADDIGYLIIDLEDGYKRGSIARDEVLEYYFTLFGANQPPDIAKKLKQIHDPKEQVGYLRARVINHLIKRIADKFLIEVDNILTGRFDEELIFSIPEGTVLKEIESVSIEKIYNALDIVEVEVAGYEVITGLLDIFIKALYNEGSRYKKVRRLIPNQYLAPGRKNFKDRYEGLLSITQFIASMTDSYAVELFRKMKGVTL
ncbi:MAG: dNTP triphosphohydrolase [Candidatus Marinimicrobia bacterium]|nr:dNTP triphosphohydrolase [Candidatus Neomarinimicrobiota bacterium]